MSVGGMSRLGIIALAAFLFLAGCLAPPKFQCPDGTLVENASLCPVPPSRVCPFSCDDANPCTSDYCSAETNYSCAHAPLSGEQAGCSGNITPCQYRTCEAGVCETRMREDCCGNGACEASEDASTCPVDCMLANVTQNVTNITVSPPPSPSSSYFGVLNADTDYSAAVELGVGWNRPMTGPFDWNMIERVEGGYDFNLTDEYVARSQANNLTIQAIIWPYNNRDQLSCHGNECKFQGIGSLSLFRCAPCDYRKYERFVRALVERYDGDGVEDMPGLREAIRYWEVVDRPSLGDGNAPYFRGTSFEYANLLRVTYGAVKASCPECEVMYGGLSDLDVSTVNFFERTLQFGAKDHFYIASLHANNAGEGVNLLSFKNVLARNNLKKEVWLTEVAYPTGNFTYERYGPGVKSLSEEEQAAVLVRSYVFALANGAKKIFYSRLKEGPTLSEEENSYALVKYDGGKRPAFYALKFLIHQIDRFTSVEMLDYGPEVRAYKFVVPSKPAPVYVFWSNEPKRVNFTSDSSAIRVSNIFGNESYEVPTQFRTAKLTLTRTPIYVEEIG
ncbi:MAG: hypothetical protein QXG98_00555 [Candidatus Micrarchaeia archaeon]